MSLRDFDRVFGETVTRFLVTALVAVAVLASVVHAARAQDADLQRAYEACRAHAVFAETRPLRQIGWATGWEACYKVEDAWHGAKKAQDDADQRHMLEKVLPNLK